MPGTHAFHAMPGQAALTSTTSAASPAVAIRGGRDDRPDLYRYRQVTALPTAVTNPGDCTHEHAPGCDPGRRLASLFSQDQAAIRNRPGCHPYEDLSRTEPGFNQPDTNCHEAGTRRQYPIRTRSLSIAPTRGGQR